MWITNGVNNKQILVTDEIPEGFHRGFPKTEDSYLKCAAGNVKRKGNIYITDGMIFKEIKPTDIIPNGWVKRVTPKKKTSRKGTTTNWIGISNLKTLKYKMIPQVNIIPDGYIKGRISKPMIPIKAISFNGTNCLDDIFI